MATKALDLTPYLLESGKVQSYAFPGGYPIFYLCADNGVLCPDCVNAERELVDSAAKNSSSPYDDDKQWLVIAADINYEDDSLFCENCNKRIESAYGENENE